MFYASNPDTRQAKHFTKEVWAHKTIGSLLLYTLGLWNDRCDCLHEASEEENTKILKNKTVAKVEKMCAAQHNILEGFEYIFQEPIDALCRRSTQYLVKWLASCRLAMKRGKRGRDTMPRRKKQRAKAKVKLTHAEGEQARDLIRDVAPYFSTHIRWMAKVYPNDDDNTIVGN